MAHLPTAARLSAMASHARSMVAARDGDGEALHRFLFALGRRAASGEVPGPVGDAIGSEIMGEAARIVREKLEIAGAFWKQAEAARREEIGDAVGSGEPRRKRPDPSRVRRGSKRR